MRSSARDFRCPWGCRVLPTYRVDVRLRPRRIVRGRFRAWTSRAGARRPNSVSRTAAATPPHSVWRGPRPRAWTSPSSRPSSSWHRLRRRRAPRQRDAVPPSEAWWSPRTSRRCVGRIGRWRQHLRSARTPIGPPCRRPGIHLRPTTIRRRAGQNRAAACRCVPCWRVVGSWLGGSPPRSRFRSPRSMGAWRVTRRSSRSSRGMISPSRGVDPLTCLRRGLDADWRPFERF